MNSTEETEMQEDTVIVAEASTMTEAEARSAWEGIRVNVEDAEELWQQLTVNRGWLVLGFATWEDMHAAAPKLRYSREERKAEVARLTDKGMSKDAIAAAMGIGTRTVSRDRQGVPSGTPCVVGLDGKTYTRPEPKPKQEQKPQQYTKAEVKAAEAWAAEQVAPLLGAIAQFGAAIDMIPLQIEELAEKVQNVRVTRTQVEEINEAICKLQLALQEALIREEAR